MPFAQGMDASCKNKNKKVLLTTWFHGFTFSLFPSKMTAYGLKTAGEEAFKAGQPTGKYFSYFILFLCLK